MKAKIVITPKKAVVDPQGKTVQNALEQMGTPASKPSTSANIWKSNSTAPTRKPRANRSTKRAINF